LPTDARRKDEIIMKWRKREGLGMKGGIGRSIERDIGAHRHGVGALFFGKSRKCQLGNKYVVTVPC